MQEITLTQEKSQSFSITLADQACVIRLFQGYAGIYMDLTLNNVPIMQGVLCLNNNKMVKYKYLGFRGDLFFCDQQGNQDPTYDGLSTRYKLFYLTQDELNV